MPITEDESQGSLLYAPQSGITPDPAKDDAGQARPGCGGASVRGRLLVACLNSKPGYQNLHSKAGIPVGIPAILEFRNLESWNLESGVLNCSPVGPTQ